MTRITGLGVNRKSVTNIYNGVPANWITTLYSCLSMLKPFSVGFVHDSNSVSWYADIQAVVGLITILWPLEATYTTGGKLTFMGALTDYSFGAADIENRVEGELIITPSGQPTVTAGAHP